MKQVAIKIVNFYQIFLHTFLVNVLGANSFCRFDVTCSNYAKQAISEHGVVIGGKMAIIRLLKCQPFYKGN